jgi:hypothetical protein
LMTGVGLVPQHRRGCSTEGVLDDWGGVSPTAPQGVPDDWGGLVPQHLPALAGRASTSLHLQVVLDWGGLVPQHRRGCSTEGVLDDWGGVSPTAPQGVPHGRACLIPPLHRGSSTSPPQRVEHLPSTEGRAPPLHRGSSTSPPQRVEHLPSIEG